MSQTSILLTGVQMNIKLPPLYAVFTVSERLLTESGRLEATNAAQLLQWAFPKAEWHKEISENLWSHNHFWPWSLSDELDPALTPPEAVRGCKPSEAAFTISANSGQLRMENSKVALWIVWNVWEGMAKTWKWRSQLTRELLQSYHL